MAECMELVVLKKKLDSNEYPKNVEPRKGMVLDNETSKEPLHLGSEQSCGVGSKIQSENARSVERRTSLINRYRVEKRFIDNISGCKSPHDIQSDTNTIGHESGGLISSEGSDIDNEESSGDEESGGEEDESGGEDEESLLEDNDSEGDEENFGKSECDLEKPENFNNSSGEKSENDGKYEDGQDYQDNDNAVLCPRRRPPSGFYSEREESVKLREDADGDCDKISKVEKGKKGKRNSDTKTSVAKEDDIDYDIFNILAKRKKKNGKFQYLPEWIPNHWVDEEDMNADQLVSEYNSKEQVEIRENVWAPIDHDFIVESKDLPNSGEHCLAILPSTQPVANFPAPDLTNFLASIYDGFGKIELKPDGFVNSWPFGSGMNSSWPGGSGINGSWPGGSGMNVSWPAGFGMNGSWPGGLGPIRSWPTGLGSVTGSNTLALPAPPISYIPIQTKMDFNTDGTPRIKCKEPGCSSTFRSMNSMKKHRKVHRNSK